MKRIALLFLIACGDHKTVTITSAHEYTVEATTSTEWGSAPDVHVTVGPIGAVRLVLVPQLVLLSKKSHCVESEQ